MFLPETPSHQKQKSNKTSKQKQPVKIFISIPEQGKGFKAPNTRLMPEPCLPSKEVTGGHCEEVGLACE